MRSYSFFTTLITMLALLGAECAFASSAERLAHDIKLPTQKVIEKQSFTNPAAAGTTDVLSGSAGNTSAAAATVSTFVAQPDVARVLVVTPGTSTVDVGTCNLVINGRNILGSSISETLAFSDNQSTAIHTTKAFKTVSSVVFPASCEDGSFAATWSIGYGESLGVKRCMDNSGDVIKSLLNGSTEGTGPTMTVDSNEVEKNTADFNGTMNGSSDFVLYFMQNYGCAR